MSLTPRPADLPEFDLPPVIEVYLSLQFQRIAGFTPAHMGLLWQRAFRDVFPTIEQRPAIVSSPETFSSDGPGRPRVHVHVAESDQALDELSRFWFIDRSGTQLVQVQQDRLIHNWRKVSGDEPYPRYDSIRERYRSDLLNLFSFLEAERLDPIVPVQCEIQYVNHIVAGDVWQSHGELSHVMTNWSDETSESGFLPQVEDAGFQTRYVITDEESSVPVGRLKIACQPAFRGEDRSPIVVLTLTARGIFPGKAGLEDAMRFFDLGRRWIVRGFTAVTTSEMHKVWKRTN